jgi:hypothetical protein
MKRGIALSICIVIALSVVAVRSPYAQWRRNGNAVSGYESWACLPAIATDEKGYSFVMWSDWREEDGLQIYGQRMNSDGHLLWAKDGVPICAAPGSFKRYAAVAMDWDQGAVVVWEDSRGHKGSIYAQRIDSEGNPCWPEEGVPVCDAPYDQGYARVVPVSSGGAIVVWLDRRGGRGYYDIYAQRLDKGGACLWAHNGVCAYSGVNRDPMRIDVVSDGSDGVIIVWQRRVWAPDQYGICAQRINAEGRCLWGENGVVVCDAPGAQWRPVVALVDRGAAIVAWYDMRNGSSDIYAQKISDAGGIVWDPDGMCVCAGAWFMQHPYVVPSGADEAIVAWSDRRSGNDGVYAQKLNCDGKLLWAPEGVALCEEPARQGLAGIVSSPDGGAIAAWYDDRCGDISVFAQKVSADGDLLWGPGGASVCSAAETSPNSCSEICIAPDPGAGAIIAWQDWRESIKDSIEIGRIYAMRMPDAAAFTTPTNAAASAFRLAQNFPNPFNPVTRIRYEIEAPATVALRIYDVEGRLVRRLAGGYRAQGRHEELWDGRDGRGRAVASGIYYYRLDAGSFTETRKMVLLR